MLKEPQWAYEAYSNWSRQIARLYTREEIEKEINILDYNRSALANSHLRAIESTTSMTSNSQRRAQSGNSFRGNYEKLNAYRNALELHEYYPEKCK